MKLSGLLHRSRPELPGSRALRGSTAAPTLCSAASSRGRSRCSTRSTSTVPPRTRSSPPGWRPSSTRRRRSPGGSRTWGRRSLIDAGIALVDDVGAEALHTIKDGSRIRLHDGVVYAGELRARRWHRADRRHRSPTRWSRPSPGSPTSSRRSPPTPSSSCASERAMLLDGVGVPGVEVELAGRQVLVVAAGFDHAAELARLKALHPRVPAGAGRRRGRGRRAARGRVTARSSSSATRPRSPPRRSPAAPTSSCPAFADGHAPGLHRVQDLGAERGDVPEHGQRRGPGAAARRAPRCVAVVTVGLSATHGRVPRPRPFGQQRLDVPHPAAARRQPRRRPGDRHALPQPDLDRRDPADDRRRAGRGGATALLVSHARDDAVLVAHPGWHSARSTTTKGWLRVISLRYHAVSIGARVPRARGRRRARRGRGVGPAARGRRHAGRRPRRPGPAR